MTFSSGDDADFGQGGVGGAGGPGEGRDAAAEAAGGEDRESREGTGASRDGTGTSYGDGSRDGTGDGGGRGGSAGGPGAEDCPSGAGDGTPGGTGLEPGERYGTGPDPGQPEDAALAAGPADGTVRESGARDGAPPEESGDPGPSGTGGGPAAGAEGLQAPEPETAGFGAPGAETPGDESDSQDEDLSGEQRPDKPNFLTSARFKDFGLPQKIIDGLDSAGFLYATPIQSMVIPEALKGKDIAGQAQTGTGKTVAFLVPVMARLMARASAKPGLPRALVVTPTRELAEQIYSDGKHLAAFTGLTLTLVIGGMDYREQARSLEEGPDIVVGTPGRLTDYIHKRVFNTDAVEVSVVDEADRLLELGFIRDLKFILSRLPSYESRQTMLFSATLSHQILELVYNFMNPPQYITAEPGPRSQDQIVQELYHVSRGEKLSLLLGLLKREEHSRVIIFCNTKSGVEWLAKKLVANGFHAEGITGDLPQPKRLRLMQSFKDNQLDIMVATDVASRGIHVEDVSHVFNYDIPQDAEDYVHRIGRTGRVGKTGKAVSFACEEYVHHLEAIENILGAKIPVIFADDDLFVKDRSGDARRRGPGADEQRGRPAQQEARATQGHGRHHARDQKSREPFPDAGAAQGSAPDEGPGDGAEQASEAPPGSGPGQQAAPPSAAASGTVPGPAGPAPGRYAVGRDGHGNGHGGSNGQGGHGRPGAPGGHAPRDAREEAFGARGLAFSDRPGGVFGLAPRLPVNASHPDVRFELTWKPSDIVSLPGELPAPSGNGSLSRAAAEASRSPEGVRGDAYDDLEDIRDVSGEDGPRPAPESGEELPPASSGAYVVAPEAVARSREEARPQPADGAAAQADRLGPAGTADGAQPAEGETGGGRRRRRRHRSRHKDSQQAAQGADGQPAADGADAAPSGWTPTDYANFVVFDRPADVGPDADDLAQRDAVDDAAAAPAVTETVTETETETEAYAAAAAPSPEPALPEEDAGPAAEADGAAEETVPAKRTRPSRSKTAVAARAAETDGADVPDAAAPSGPKSPSRSRTVKAAAEKAAASAKAPAKRAAAKKAAEPKAPARPKAPKAEAKPKAPARPKEPKDAKATKGAAAKAPKGSGAARKG
ncbi:MAG: DEAD/DEAH box helicase [Deltaproteobacteria bacterium]|jgi:ATP-dependent RNA helicase RhlB|nr:DEAD/DEAH box helicase [Deltaproteobacteria bacterium]